MAWLTMLGVSMVGMIGCLLAGIVTLGSGHLNLAFSGVAVVLCIFLPILCGVLIAVFGPWLRRFFPFSQALLFGALALAQWSPTRRGAKAFWPVLAGTLLVYITAFVFATMWAQSSQSDPQSEPQSSRSCSFVDAQGNETEVSCGIS